MGCRAYLIKYDKGKFTAVYYHWFVCELERIARNGVTREELLKLLHNKWMEAYKNESEKGDGLIYTLDSISSLMEFIEFEDIGIEAWVLLWDNRFEIFLPLIRNFINGAIRVGSKEIDQPYVLSWAFGMREKAEAIVDFLEVLEFPREQAAQMLDTAWLRMKNHMGAMFELVISKNLAEAVSKHKTLPLHNINGILYY
jgi:hypothetical protein